MKGLKVTRLQTLLVFLCGLIGPATAQAQLTFSTNSGAITITGYTGTSGEVVIPATINGYPVKKIGDSAFYNLTSVTNISLPGSITNIDFQAFTRSGLTSITIPDSVINIGQSAFMYCSSLASVTIGSGVNTIVYDTFYGCTSLTNMLIPQNVTNIYSTAFVYCTNLIAFEIDPSHPAFKTISGVLFNKNETELLNFPGGQSGNYTFPNGVTSIGSYAFAFCFNLTNFVIPDGVTNIGEASFYGCKNATTFTLPSSLLTIGAGAFSSCSQLASIGIPANVTSIGSSAFSSTALTSVLIPASVTNIGPGAFGYCFSLDAINVAANNPAYVSVAGVLFNGNLTVLVEFPIRKSGTIFQATSYTIPTGVTTIGAAAFQSCRFSNVFIPNGVTSIGSQAFSSCPRLTSLSLPNGVTNIGYGAFAGTGITNLTVPSSVTTFEAFGGWSNLRNIYFLGDAPNPGTNNYVLLIINGATVYYLPSTTGWGTKLFGVPTALWLPTLQGAGGSLINQSGQFSFNVNWASGQTVVIEASTSLWPAVWLPLVTNTLAGSSTNFTDPDWRDFSARFYRVRKQ